jgi:hypothetical protein
MSRPMSDPGAQDHVAEMRAAILRDYERLPTKERAESAARSIMWWLSFDPGDEGFKLLAGIIAGELAISTLSPAPGGAELDGLIERLTSTSLPHGPVGTTMREAATALRSLATQNAALKAERDRLVRQLSEDQSALREALASLHPQVPDNKQEERTP